jgi:hypothetical protein
MDPEGGQDRSIDRSLSRSVAAAVYPQVYVCKFCMARQFRKKFCGE